MKYTPPKAKAHYWKGKLIRQRSEDGYFDAYDMHKATGRRPCYWQRLTTTPEVIDTVSRATGLPAEALYVRVGRRHLWVHPLLAPCLAGWMDEELGKYVAHWGYPDAAPAPTVKTVPVPAPAPQPVSTAPAPDDDALVQAARDLLRSRDEWEASRERLVRLLGR